MNVGGLALPHDHNHAMEPAHNVSPSDLSAEGRQLLDAVRRGETVFVEEEGRAEAALMDIVDYRILRAVMHALAAKPEIDPDKGLPGNRLVGDPGEQERYNQVLAHYLGQAISLGRAAELLEMAPGALRDRFDRLEVPRRIAPGGEEEARRDVQTALNWSGESS
jgi:predicted HTH domain antitoxin/antitoxin (DNA-binding transcriptional repressor) of toxin-antitoxin stability system